MSVDSLAPGYAAAVGSAGWIDRSDRVRIEVTGPDRAKLFHNLTTNDIKRLKTGSGAEAFVTSGQGRTLAFVAIHAEEDRLLVRSDPGTAEAILAHLAKYGPFEDAAPRDVSSETAEWHLAGALARDVLADLGIPSIPADLGIGHALVAGRPVRLIGESPTARPGVTLISSRADAEEIEAALRLAVEARAGTEIDPGVFEALRIEAGTPLFGRDFTPTNLPQEVNRDARAISFVKGCYLGQETVARLDALGHVNKILVGAVSDSDRVPPPGSTLRADDKDIGVVTSSAFSPGLSRGVVLGYVKVAHATPGSRIAAVVDGESIPLEVRAWPMFPGPAEG
jgi:folate-binding protein YgfZ